MKRRIALVAIAALALVGCSQQALDAGFKNLTSAQCANQAATVQNIPLGFLTPAQAQQVIALACSALYGTTAAPTTAVGQAPVLK